MPMSANDFLKAALDSGIISPEFFSTCAAGSTVAEDAESLSGRLVDEGRLTAFQAHRIRDGKAEELVLGPYVLLEVLGKGGMGTVYKAEHRKMRRVVALKVIAETGLTSPEAMRRFEREVEAAARLDHPNIVTAYDAGEAAGTHYLVMQLVEGKSLSEIVKTSGPQPPARAVAWALQAAHGLAYAHGRGVVHRDIKPGNLLLDREGTLKILDMGLARLESLSPDQDQLTGTGQVMGTVDFMAPEQALETRLADARSDIYSLGVTLWYLLTGRPLFAGNSVVQKIMAHQQKPPPTLAEEFPAIDPRLEAAFQRMVAKRPDDRFQSMQQVITALEILPHESVPSASIAGIVGHRSGVATRVGAGTSPRSSSAIELEPTGQLNSVGSEEPTAEFVAAAGGSREARSTWWTPARRTGTAAAAVLAVAVAIVLVGRRPQTTNPSASGTSVDAVRPRHDRQPPAAEAMATESPPANGGGAASLAAPPPAIAPFDAEQARAHQEAWAKHLGIPVASTNSIGATLVVIPPGRFRMGPSGWITKGEGREFVDVTLTRPFLIGQTEITQGQWRVVMGSEPWQGKPVGDGRTYSIEGDDVAATHFTWSEAAEYCTRLTERERLAGRIRPDQEYRLPTEAEWEYACRAGTITQYSFGNDTALLEDYGWYGAGWNNDKKIPIPGGNTRDAMHPRRVRLKKPNSWGLHDMHGNVMEWCQDTFAGYPAAKATDPIGAREGASRVTRGGSWTNDAATSSSPSRSPFPESYGGLATGFRIVLTVSAGRPLESPASAQPDATAAPPPAIAPFDAEQARRHQEAWAKHLGIPVESTNSIGATLLVIPPGRFTMGEGRFSTDVTLTKPFLIGQTEITQLQWRTIMGSEPWKGKPLGDGRTYVIEGDDVAATHVTWSGAAEYCSRLTERERLAGRIQPDQEYRLPTDAEWEYACRAGTFTRYVFGDDAAMLDDYGWYGGGWDKDKGLPIPGGNTGDAMHPHAVRLKKPNAWGLHDMHGNVSEWCQDHWIPRPQRQPVASATDPQGPPSGSERVIRGGNWIDVAANTSAVSCWGFHEHFISHAGVRLVLTAARTLPSAASAAVPASPGAALYSDLVPHPVADKAAPPPAMAPFDAAQARTHQEAWAKHLGIPVETTNSIGTTLVLIPPGRFTMGEDDKPVAVTLTKPFLLGRTEVTQRQWREMMGSEPWKGIKYTVEAADVAATWISWDDAISFCRKLTARERGSGRLGPRQEYRLPTEAEWEYACRAGTITTYSFGDAANSLGDHAWFGGGWNNVPVPGGNTATAMHAHGVGLKRPNPWRLFDMHGNVWEWVADWQGELPSEAMSDPQGPAGGSHRVFRGGSWDIQAKLCGSAYREGGEPSIRATTLGFRVALSPAEPMQREAAEPAFETAPTPPGDR